MFLKCLMHMPLQIPVVATILALINTTKCYHGFAELVVEKLLITFECSFSELNICKCKLVLRALACLTSCGCVALTDTSELSGGLLGLLNNLLRSVTEGYSLHNQILVYLLTTSLPYCIDIIRTQGGTSGAQYLSQLESLCQSVIAAPSDYGIDGRHASFVINCLENESGWDTLQRLSSVALNSIRNNTASSSSSSSGSLFILAPWKYLQSELGSSSTFADIDSYPSDVTADSGMEVTEEGAGAGDSGAVVSIAIRHLHPSGTSAADKYNLTVANISNYLGCALGKDRRDVRCVTIENRELRDRNACAAAWLGLSVPIFDLSSDVQHPLLALSPEDRVWIADYARDVIVFFEPYIRNDGTYVGSVAMLVQHLLNIFKIYAVNASAIAATASGDSSLLAVELVQCACEYVIVETLMLMLIQIPAYNPLCVHRILFELCRVNHTPYGTHNIPSMVATACIGLYQLAPAMDTLAWRSLTQWLSFHLVNFKLSWPYWQYWSQEYAAVTEGAAGAGGQVNDVSKAFIHEVVEKCARLSFPTAMKATLPAVLHPCMPVQEYLLTDTQTTSLNYSLLPVHRVHHPEDGSELTPVQGLALEVYQRMSTRVDAGGLEDWLDAAYLPDSHSGNPDGEEYSETYKCCILTEAAVCAGGSGRMLSTLVGVLDRYCELLLSYTFNAENGQQVSE